MPILVIAINLFLIKLAHKGVVWIGWANKSILVSKIQSAVFFSVFANDGITILLINANLTEL